VSRDLFKFWEISDHTSETIQDRDIVAREEYWDIVCGLSNGIGRPSSDLESP